jgi:hypothetical protein
MKAEEIIIACSRPIMFELDNPYARYGIGGSAVLGSYFGVWFLLTADHCLDYVATHPTKITNEHVKMLMVPLIDGSRLFFSYTAFTNTRRQAKDILDKTDMAILRIAPPSQAALEGLNLDVISFDCCSKLPLDIPVGTRLVMRGYPHSLKNEASYSDDEIDAGDIRRQGLLNSGTYIGNDPYAEACHIFKIDCLNKIPGNDLNGMSGSPVFSITQTTGNKEILDFAGLFIGRKKFLPDQGIFIDRSVFISRLTAVINASLQDRTSHPIVGVIKIIP